VTRHHLDKRAASLIHNPPEDFKNDDDLLTTTQVASWFGVTVQWLELSRPRGLGPPFVKISSQMVRYRRGELIAWLKEREQNSLKQFDDEQTKAARARAAKSKARTTGRSTRGSAATTG
jgi:hypothetical protein